MVKALRVQLLSVHMFISSVPTAQCAVLGEQWNEIGLGYFKEVDKTAFGDWLIGQNSPQEDALWNISYVKSLKMGVKSIFKVLIETVVMKNHLNIQTVS